MSTLRATNIKNESSASNNIVLDVGGGVSVSGVTTVTAGSASAPSISPSGDSNTGIFFPTADTIAFAEGGVESLRIDSSGRLLVGTNTALSANGTADWQQQVASTGPIGILLSRFSNNVNPPRINLLKSRSGTIGSNTIVSNGDTVGAISFLADDGTNYTGSTSEIKSEIDGVPGTGSLPGRLVFSTTPTGGNGVVERARIDSSGRLLIGTTSTISGGVIDVSNPAQSSLPRLQVAGTDWAQSSAIIASYQNAAAVYPQISFNKSKSGTVGTIGAALDSGDALGGVTFAGSDGTKFLVGASIAAFTDASCGTNDLPGRLVFATTADGASSPTERMRIDSQGRMGLGTASPGTNLDIVGSGLTIARVKGGSGSSQGAGFYVVKAGSTNTLCAFGDRGSAFGGAVDQAASIYTDSGIPLTFDIASSERARIDSSGRLLVGTSTASRNVRAIFAGGTGADPGAIQIESLASTPTSGADIGVLNWTGANGNRGAMILCTAGSNWSASNAEAYLSFQTTANAATSPTERMRITSDGAVLIGTTSTSSQGRKLNIEDSVSTSNHGPLRVVNTNASADRVCTIGINNSGGGTLIAFDVNNVGKGSITTNGSTISYNTSSDYRLKENVSAVSDGITRLQQLKPSRFNFIADPAKTVDGFLAHEAAEVVPECVTGEKDAVDDEGNPIYQGIDQSKLVPLLTAALQEAVAKIESLEARLTAAGI